MKIRAAYFVVLLIAIPWLVWNGFVRQWNDQAIDILMRLRPAPANGSEDQIVLVAIDDAAAARFGPLPIKRETLAVALKRLSEFHPSVVGIDMLIAEEGPESGDRALVDAVKRLPRVTVGAALSNDSQTGSRWVLPISPLREVAAVGHVHDEPDADGVVRSVLLAKRAGGERFWALALEAVAQFTHAGRPVETIDALRLGNLTIPTALMDGSADRATFLNKMVILGVTAQGTGDRHFTPVSSGIGMSGIEIHANVARTILDEAFLIPVSLATEVALFVFVGAMCILLVMRLRGFVLAGALALLTFGIVAASYLALESGSIWPVGSLLVVAVTAATLSVAGEYASVTLALRGAEDQRRQYAFRVQAIAHEIKNPLAAIQGSSEMIADGALPGELRDQMAGLIHKESRRLNTLVRTFLDVERMAAGALEIHKQPVELAEVCEGVLEQARLYAAKKKIDVEAEMESVRVQADPDLLGFAVYNLLTNAVKYSPKHTTVRLQVGDNDGFAVVTVTDQGHGIAPDEQQRVFERFYRLKREEKNATEGTGIGLAMVKEIVTQHGGRVNVESSPGSGSSFTLLIPKE